MRGKKAKALRRAGLKPGPVPRRKLNAAEKLVVMQRIEEAHLPHDRKSRLARKGAPKPTMRTVT